MIGGGKEGRIYLIDTDNMGKYDANQDHVVQESVMVHGDLSTPAYFNNTIYLIGGYGDVARTFSIVDGVMSSSATSQSPDSFGFPGASPSISADGTTNGIVWDLDHNSNQLRAYRASSYADELYTSAQAPNNRDQIDGGVVKFTVPTVVNGMVYVGTSDALDVFGLLQLPTSSPAAPSRLSATAISGSQVNLAWTANSTTAAGYNVQISTDGANFTQIATAGATATSYSVVGLQPLTSYTFRISAFNNVGTSAYSNTATANTSTGLNTGFSYASGFANSSGSLILNGNAKIVGSALQLTNGTPGQVSSVFSNSKVDVTSFTSQFSFQLLNANGDGFTFTIQGLAAAALGPGGGGLGYGGPGGIPNSLAITFNLYNGVGQGNDSTALLQNGAGQTKAGSINLSNTGINLHSGHVFNVLINYDGAHLTVTITDATTGAAATQVYAVNIATIVGGPSAYVGFTGASGGNTAVQNILSWTYTHPIPPPPQAPTNLTVTATSGTQTTVTWTDNSNDATDFLIERATSASGLFTQIADVPGTVTSYFDSNLIPTTEYFYRVRATNTSGTSSHSNVATATVPVPPATPTNARTTLVTATEIDLSWQLNSTNEDGIAIFLRAADGDFNPLVTLPPGTTSYQNVNLTPNTEYDYHIRVFNAAGYSDFAGVATTTLTSGPPPAAPTNLVASPGQGEVALSWPVSIGATSYNIYRSTSPGGEGSTPFYTDIGPDYFIDTHVASNTTYYYKVSAVGWGGEGALTSEASVTVPPSPVSLSAGFTGAGTLLSLNGSTKINGTTLQLTDGGANESGSAFTTAPVSVAQFTTQFDFQLINPNADGMTFAIQGVSPTALGSKGGGLGYGAPSGGGTGGIRQQRGRQVQTLQQPRRRERLDRFVHAMAPRPRTSAPST